MTTHDQQPAPEDLGKDNPVIPGTVADLYRQLSREDLPTRSDPQVAHGMPYITGETCRTVLNKLLGPHAWSFRVLEQFLDKEADEVVVHGELSVNMPTGLYLPDGQPVTHQVAHQQFGSSKLKRSRSTGAPVDLGFEYKAAGTDCLKKCATDIGVGLWLSRKEETTWDPEAAAEGKAPSRTSTTRPSTASSASSRPESSPTATQARPSTQTSTSSSQSASRPGNAVPSDGKHCEVCGKELKPVDFKDGKSWSVETLASYGKSKYNAVLCMPDYRKAKDNKLPPRDQWTGQAKAQSTSTRPRPAAADKSTDNGHEPTPATVLKAVRDSLERKANESGKFDVADAEQVEWVEGLIYEAAGDQSTKVLELLFGKRALSYADIDAVEAWTSADDKWQKRVEFILSGQEQTAAAS